MGKTPLRRSGKRALPSGITTKRVSISLPRYHEALMSRAMQRSSLGTSEFFRVLIAQAVGARIPLFTERADEVPAVPPVMLVVPPRRLP